MAKGKGDDADPKGKKKKGKKGEDGEKPPKAKRSRGGIRPVRLGILAAALIAGPPLYRLVQEGSLDSTTALTKVGIVALGITIGISWIRGLVVDYQAEIELEKRRKAARAQEILRMIELENAAKAAEAAQAEAAARKAARRNGGSSSSSTPATASSPAAPSAANPSAGIPAQPGVPQPAQPA